MIWFDIKELERGLKNEELSDNTIFNYLLANLIIYSLASYVASNEYKTNTILLLELIVTLSITIIGTKRAFDINSGGDSKDFLKRYLSLSFVSGVRLVVFITLPFGIIKAISNGGMGTKYNNNTTDLFDIFLTGVVGLVYYLILTNSFKRVSRPMKV